MTDDETATLIASVEQKAREFALSYFRDETQAEDAVQEWALQLWEIRDKLDSLQNARAYAIGRMNNVFLQIWRRKRQSQGLRATPMPGELDAPGAKLVLSTGGESAHLRDMEVRRAFDLLPPALYDVAWLVLAEGCPVSETARRLGLARATVADRLYEARTLLQARLKGWE